MYSLRMLNQVYVTVGDVYRFNILVLILSFKRSLKDNINTERMQ